MSDCAISAYRRGRDELERTLLCYLAIFVFSRLQEILPLGSVLTRWLRRPWEIVVPWFGEYLLRLNDPVSISLSSSRDRLFDWIQAVFILVLSIVVVAAWRWLGDVVGAGNGRGRTFAHIVIRYGLAAAMLSYGMSKLLLEQMPPPPLATLTEPIGQFSPMRLFWTTMGMSSGYSLFAGGAEVVGGLLLLSRRTAVLGGLLLLPVLVNVLLLNLCYDIPVKLNAAHYVLMAVVLAAPALRALSDGALRNRQIEPGSQPPRRFAFSFGALRWLVVMAVLVLIPGQRILRQLRAPVVQKSELFGLYVVDSFSLNGRVHPPLLTDTERWRYVAIDLGDVATVVTMNDERRVFQIRRGPGAGHLILRSLQDSRAPQVDFIYEQIPSRGLALSGKIDDATLELRLLPADEHTLRLLRDRFQWVHERPSYR